MKAAIITIWRRNAKSHFEPVPTWTVSLYIGTYCVPPSLGVGESNRFRCNLNGIIHGNK
jgi:hypothetical protein